MKVTHTDKLANKAKNRGDKYRAMSLVYAGSVDTFVQETLQKKLITKLIIALNKRSKDEKSALKREKSVIKKSARAERRKKRKKQKALTVYKDSHIFKIPLHNRLEWLKGRICGKRASKKQIQGTRASFNKVKFYRLPIEGNCYACENNVAEHRHHIKPIEFGGGNDLGNLALLCIPCHELLHPFMKTSETLPELETPSSELQSLTGQQESCASTASFC